MALVELLGAAEEMVGDEEAEVLEEVETGGDARVDDALVLIIVELFDAVLLVSEETREEEEVDDVLLLDVELDPTLVVLPGGLVVEAEELVSDRLLLVVDDWDELATLEVELMVDEGTDTEELEERVVDDVDEIEVVVLVAVLLDTVEDVELGDDDAAVVELSAVELLILLGLGVGGKKVVVGTTVDNT